MAVIIDPPQLRKILRHLVKIGRTPPGFDPVALNETLTSPCHAAHRYRPARPAGQASPLPCFRPILLHSGRSSSPGKLTTPRQPPQRPRSSRHLAYGTAFWKSIVLSFGRRRPGARSCLLKPECLQHRRVSENCSVMRSSFRNSPIVRRRRHSLKRAVSWMGR